MAKFLIIGSNGYTTQESTVSVGGVGNAGKIAHLNASGQWDESMMPSGIGADTDVRPASENLSAGDIVNIFNDGGTIKCRKADAGVNKYKASGYVKAAVTAGDDATIYFDGKCAGTFTINDIMKPVFLGDTAGSKTLTPVSGSGKIHQEIGSVTSLTEFDFEPQSPIELV